MEAICGANCMECQLFKEKSCVGCSLEKGCPKKDKCFIAKYILVGGMEKFNELKKELLNEINTLNIEGMPKVEELYALRGDFVNLEYSLPNNQKVCFLNDDEIYLGSQVESVFNDDEIKKCYGVVANTGFILVCEYDEDGLNPEIILYKRR